MRLQDNYPFQHPRYAGQMLKPPHPVAVAAYAATMLINPNNHALDGGPATAALEKDVVAQLATMFGFETHLGHLASSGTTGNLEALFVARESHPGRGVAYSAEAHYTHARMCHVLGMQGHAVPADALGRMDVDALAELLATGRVGTVVATLGTTGLGAVDPVDAIVALAREHGVRVHVDAAYGGFFSLVADDTDDGRASRRPSEPYGMPTRSSSTRTSTGSSPTAAARCCSPTRRSGGSTPTTRPTPTSPPTSCTSARSRWSARAPAQRLRRSGRRCGAAADARRVSAPCCARACAPPVGGRVSWPSPRCSTSTRHRSWTSCPTCRGCRR